MVPSDLITLASRLGCQSGAPTAIPELVFWRADAPTSPTSALFEPKFYLVLQGAKRMVIGGEPLEFGPGACAVAAVGLPFTHEVKEASAERPYLSVQFTFDPGVIAGLILEMPDHAERSNRTFASARVDASVSDALERLIRLLDAPDDLAVLGAQIERELCYRLLKGSMGGTLRQIGRANTRFGQIRAAAEWIGANANKPMRVDQLAALAGMSLTSFHRHFKAVTSHSPLAYQRYIRLLDARRRLASGAVGVTETAFATGYASAPQFTREYKRAFGVPPVHDAASLRQ